MVTVQSLQDEILQALYTALGDETFTASQGYNAVKSVLPLNSIVQNARDLGALLNACNLKPVGDIRVERAGYDSHKKIARWKLVHAQVTPIPANPANIVRTLSREGGIVVYGTDNLAIIWLLSVWYSSFNAPITAPIIARWLDLAGIDRVEEVIKLAVNSPDPVSTVNNLLR